MTRHSAHDLSASVVSAAGGVVVRPTDVRVQLSESRFPFGRADVTIPLPQGEPVPSYTDWVEQRRNLVGNPDAKVNIAGFGTNASAGWSFSRVADSGNGLPDGFAFRAERSAASSAAIAFDFAPPIPVVPGEVYAVSYDILGNAAWGTTLLRPRVIWNTAAPAVEGVHVAFNTVYQRVEQTVTVPDGVTAMTIRPYVANGPLGAALRARRIQASLTAGAYVDGDLNPNGVLERTRWLGVANGSPSVLEVREQDSFVLLPDARLEVSNPRAGDARLLLDLRESVGDPVQVSEITFGLGGNMAALTAAFTGDVAAVTAAYATPWNDDLTIVGSAARMNMVLHSREVDHAAGVVRLTAYTDEALAVMYRLVSTLPETSSSLSVRDTVNFALSKIGATLLPGTVDAVIEEPSAIVWEPGVSAWEYIRNVAEAAGLVVRCDGRRRWTLTRRDETRPELVVLDRSIGIVERIDVDAQQYADAVVVRYDWTDPTTGESRTRYDTASQTSTPGTVKLVERRVPYPGRGAAAYWLKRLAARGRAYDITQVNDYSIRPGMQFTAPVPATPTQVGRIETIEWALPTPVMTVTTTGAADAVPGAIDLFPDGIFINDLVGVINDLNPGSEAAA